MKNFTSLNVIDKRIWVLISALIFSGSTFSQTVIYPTQEQIDAKLAAFAAMNWETPIGNINRSSGSGVDILVTGTEQDCAGGIPVCSQSYTQSTSYTGKGSIQEVNGNCLSGGETNSAWYIFTAQTTGNFGFSLVTTKDYDFALYNITATGCAGIPTSSPVRCNFSGTYGNTGMSPAGSAASVGASGSPWCTELAVTAGQTYALIVDNWTADATGYTLNFTTGGGYASITDITPPTINPPASVVNNCNGTFTLNFSEPVKCSSIAANGSDFTISGGGVVTGAVGVGCTGSAILTSQVTITYTVPTSGTFTLGVKVGSDGNTILDKCSNAMLNTQTITLNILNAITLTSSQNTICVSGTAVTLTASGAPNSIANIYTLSPGGAIASSNGSGQATFTVNPTATTTYVVSASYAGCTATALTTVILVNNVVVSISPVNPTICSGTTSLTASTLVNGTPCVGCTFQWSGSSTATTATITAGAGTYNVTTATSGGCAGANTATSTVTIASASSGASCNIYYVSPAGGGTGLTKASPTTLANALSLSMCQNSTIKMQTGIYTLSDFLLIQDFVTIEGGYNSTFTTKTSNMASGSATTIRRNNTVDSDNSATCTAFRVQSSADGWRLQDLRIELPGSTNVAGHTSYTATSVSNYAVKLLGTGSTGYSVVRCYIDAGVGTAQY